MNGKEHQAFIEQMARNRLAKVHGDIWQAYYAAVHDLHVLGHQCSMGLLRLRPHLTAGHCELPPPSIEDPGTGPESQITGDPDEDGE